MIPIVIYIDDSDDALSLASAIVENDKRFDLLTLRSNEELIETLKTITPDAAIIDLNLGDGMTGTILAVKLRAAYPNLPIAIYTAYEKSRVEKLVSKIELQTGKIRTWEKSKIGVADLADSIADLLKA